MLEKITIVKKPSSISWQQITDLLHEAYRVHLNNHLHFYALVQSADITEQRVKNGTCWVALLEGRLVGTISFERHFNRPKTSWYIEDDYISIFMFGVLEEFKGFGIGSMLIDAVEEYARTKNSKAIILDTAWPAKKLVQFYRNRGYKPVGATTFETTNYVSVLLKKEINCQVVPEEICLKRFEEEKQKYSARQKEFEMECRNMETAKNPIAIVIANMVQFYSILPAMKELDRHGVRYDIFVPHSDSPEARTEGWYSLEQDTVDYLLLNGYKPMQTVNSYHYILCLSAYPNIVPIKADINIRYRYGYVTKPEFSYSVGNGIFYDYVLCYNKEDASILSAYAKTLVVGELKLADYRHAEPKSSRAKKTLLYLPTHGEGSSIPAVCKVLANLANQYDIIVKAHHGTSFLTVEQSAIQEIKQTFYRIYDSRTPLYDLLAEADLALSDNSGAIFDAIATEVPVAIFNQYPMVYFEGTLSPQYQLIQDGIVPATGDPAQLANILEKALMPEYIEKQKKAKSQIFGVDGEHCLSVFWDFIRNLLDRGAEKGYQSAHGRLYREYQDLNLEKNRIWQSYQAVVQEKQKVENILLHKNTEADKLYQAVLYHQKANEQNEEIINDIKTSLDEKEKEANELYQSVLYHQKTNEHNEKTINDIKTSLDTKEKEANELYQSVLYFQGLSKQYEDDYAQLQQSMFIVKEKLNLVLSQVNNINDCIFPYLRKQVIDETTTIASILSYKNFSKMLKIYSIISKFKHESILKKIKLILKLMLRCIGIKKPLYIEEYRMDYKIKNALNGILQALPNPIATEKYEEIHTLKLSHNSEQSSAHTRCPELLYATCPKVSVLMPVYNHANYIRDAIYGVQNQTYQNWELIILDDGSTDNLHDVLKEFKNDTRIQIYCGVNQGLPNALTCLHQLTTGEFITWSSADNIMLPEMLSKLTQTLITDLSASAVFADVAIIDDKGQYVTQGYREMNRDEKQPYIMRFPHSDLCLGEEQDNFINACFMYRADVARALCGQYAADLTGLEDYDFWLRIKAFGRIKHIKNSQPLYLYRVHDNTLSQELLTNKRDEHIKRGNMLMDFSKKREQYLAEPLYIDFVKDSAFIDEFQHNLKSLHCFVSDKVTPKKIVYTDINRLDSLEDDCVAITQDKEKYGIHIKSDNKVKKCLEFFKGIDINPIAHKARYTKTQGHFWEYPERFISKDTLGCHVDFSLIDIEKTKEFLKCNQNILFLFCATPGTGDGKTVNELASCENALYLGECEVGCHYQRLASWSGVFIPPLNKTHFFTFIQGCLLAWASGKWLLYDIRNNNFGVFLFTYSYSHNETLLGIKKVVNIAEAEDLLDIYIHHYSVKGTLERLLTYAGAIGQDIYPSRPQFMLHYKNKQPIQKLEFMPNFSLLSERDGYIALAVETLDKGGLEQVVAFLARQISQHQINVRVLCLQHGGEVAQLLKTDGFIVEEFHSDRSKFENYLLRNKPILINSHYVNSMLDIPSKLNIPVISVLHNMYVAFSEDDWNVERRNAHMTCKMIAVSKLVKDVYIRKHGNIDKSKIIVVENAASASNLNGNNRKFTRHLLGIGQNSTVFVNVSSFDARKNQLGLITAFEHFYNTVSKDSYLILMGNPLSEFYSNIIKEYIVNLGCKNNLLMLDYHKDVTSILRAADIFVMPSYFEGWSIAATEALYCGLPLIHSKCGSGIELIKGGENGLLIDNPAGDIASLSLDQLFAIINQKSPPNTNELVNAMNQMHLEIDVWRAKREQIASTSLRDFPQNEVVEGYLSVFSSIIENW